MSQSLVTSSDGTARTPPGPELLPYLPRVVGLLLKGKYRIVVWGPCCGIDTSPSPPASQTFLVEKQANPCHSHSNLIPRLNPLDVHYLLPVGMPLVFTHKGRDEHQPGSCLARSSPPSVSPTSRHTHEVPPPRGRQTTSASLGPTRTRPRMLMLQLVPCFFLSPVRSLRGQERRGRAALETALG